MWYHDPHNAGMTAPTHPADERILAYYRDNPPEYVPLVANRLGIHLRYAERRVAVLVEQGLLEAVSHEVIYTITEDGEQALDGGTVTVDRDTAADD
jgi:hypothetical protein